MAGCKLVIRVLRPASRPRSNGGAVAHNSRRLMPLVERPLHHLADGGVKPVEESMAVRSGGHPPVQVPRRPGEDRSHVALVGLLVRQFLQGPGFDLVQALKHLDLQAVYPAERRGRYLGPDQRGRVEGADGLIRQRAGHRLCLAFAEFREAGPRVLGVQLAQHVAGGLSVADEQQLHASSFALPGPAG